MSDEADSSSPSRDGDLASASESNSRLAETAPPESEFCLSHWSSSLRCNICWEYYNSPKSLPCGHSFCKGCIEGVIRETREQHPHARPERFWFSCPLCRRRIKSVVFRRHCPNNVALEAAVSEWMRSPERQARLHNLQQSGRSETVNLCASERSRSDIALRPVDAESEEEEEEEEGRENEDNHVGEEQEEADDEREGDTHMDDAHTEDAAARGAYCIITGLLKSIRRQM